MRAMQQSKGGIGRRARSRMEPSVQNQGFGHERKETEYLRWLAAERGFGEVCQQCKGRGQTAAIFGSRPCAYCNGSGGSGIRRARAHVAGQRDELDIIAFRAVDGLKHTLFWRGLRPVVCGGSVKPALAAAEHDAREAERDRLDAALAEVCEAIYAAEATANADYRDVTDGADLSEILSPVHAAHKRERDIADRRFALGHVDEPGGLFRALAKPCISASAARGAATAM